MNALSAQFCDGSSLRSHAVQVEFLSDGNLRLTGDGVDRVIPHETIRITDALGTVPRFIHLSDNGVIEIANDPALTAWLETSRQRRPISRFIHWLESRAVVAAIATLLLVATVGIAFWQGLPRLARHGAYAVPPALEQQAGWTAYSVLTRHFAPSALSYNDRMHAQRALERLTAVHAPHVELRLIFFHMGSPNAFALPGGIIVFSDELYHLARNDDEIAAVLAHELGHIEKRHGLQSVLRNSSALIVVSTLTGDLSTLSTFSATLPFLLLQFGYAREFEREADDYAAGLLQSANIAPASLAAMLERLEQVRPAEGPDFTYFSTHPPTARRIEALQGISVKGSATTSIPADDADATAPAQASGKR